MAPGTIAIDVRNRSDAIRTDWFGTAISNPGFMESLLCTAAVHLYLVGKASYATIVYHQTRAITAIKSAISDPRLKLSDANIGAVLNLLCVEESLALPVFERVTANKLPSNQRKMHLDALRSMVEMRGGLEAMESTRCLQAFLLWYVDTRVERID